MDKETLRKAMYINKKLNYANVQIDRLCDRKLYTIKVFLNPPDAIYNENYDIEDSELVDEISKLISTYYKKYQEEQEQKLNEL